MGYCKEGEKCKFSYPERDCQMFFERCVKTDIEAFLDDKVGIFIVIL